MNLDAREIDKTICRLRFLLFNADDQTKMRYYWELLKECLHNNRDNINWAGEQWTQLLTEEMEAIKKGNKAINEATSKKA